jgi:hypothetical protein
MIRQVLALGTKSTDTDRHPIFRSLRSARKLVQVRIVNSPRVGPLRTVSGPWASSAVEEFTEDARTISRPTEPN